MASSIQYILFSTFLLFLIAPSLAQKSFRPKALVVPVTKDATTLQYLTRINQRTPLVPISLVVDLGGQFLWVDCEQNYVSSTYRPAVATQPNAHLLEPVAVGIAIQPLSQGATTIHVVSHLTTL